MLLLMRKLIQCSYLLISCLFFTFALSQCKRIIANEGKMVINPDQEIDRSKFIEYGRDLKKYVRDANNAEMFPSFASVVSVNGEIVWYYFIHSSPSEQYGLASITKTITGTLIMNLVQDGIIDLDDPASKYLNGYKIEREDLHSGPVLIRHLMAHTSGLPDTRHYKDVEWDTPAQYGIPESITRQAYPAGEHFSYSNQNFILLGHIIENVTSQSLPEYYKQKMFGPYQMKNTGFTEPYSGAFGIRSSLKDMLTYCESYLNDDSFPKTEKLLYPDTITLMLQRPVTFPSGTDFIYHGLSWHVESSNGEVVSFSHIGGSDGMMGWVQVFPQYSACAVYLADPPKVTGAVVNWEVEMQNRMGWLLTYYLGETKPVHLVTPSTVSEDFLAGLNGVYVSPLTGEKITVLNAGNLQKRIYYSSGSYDTIYSYSSKEFLGQDGLYDFLYNPFNEAPSGLATLTNYYTRKE